LEVKLTDRHLKNCHLANVRKASDNVKSLAQNTAVYITACCKANGPSAIKKFSVFYAA
jgi:tRNA G10  N-methylase Trm11